jgi:hypothetical protein
LVFRHSVVLTSFFGYTKLVALNPQTPEFNVRTIQKLIRHFLTQKRDLHG